MSDRQHNPPPLGPEIGDLRICSRDLDFPNGKACGKTPFLHVCWSWDEDGGASGFVCHDHAAELTRKGWYPADAHEVGPDCGMPGALWYVEEKTCRVPDDDAGATATAATGYLCETLA